MYLIADTCTRIRNAIAKGRSECTVLRSRLVLGVVQVLWDEGMIQAYDTLDREIRIRLRREAMREIRAVSLPSVRRYAGYRDLSRLIRPWEILVLSTTNGVLTHRQAAEQRVGGVLLARCR